MSYVSETRENFAIILTDMEKTISLHDNYCATAAPTPCHNNKSIQHNSEVEDLSNTEDICSMFKWETLGSMPLGCHSSVLHKTKNHTQSSTYGHKVYRLHSTEAESPQSLQQSFFYLPQLHTGN